MSRQATALALAFTLYSFAGTCFSQNPDLLEYEAEYAASANGLAATATRSLSKIDAHSYRLSNSLEASLAGQTLASLEQLSEFRLQAGQVLPLSYSYQLSGVSRASHAIFFNWDAQVAVSTEDDDSWQLQLHEGVMDQLSYQVAIRQALIDSAPSAPSFSFDIIDGDEIETHSYRLVGEESVATPLGTLDTVKLERVREASDKRLTEIWLAVDWGFLLTRIEQVNASGLRIVLELKSAQVEGRAITANN